jgi:hypothetical protein
MENKMGRSCSTYWNEVNAYRILVEKSKGKKPLGKPKCRWEDNIKLALT